LSFAYLKNAVRLWWIAMQQGKIRGLLHGVSNISSQLLFLLVNAAGHFG
jgi:hypothetical protein